MKKHQRSGSPMPFIWGRDPEFTQALRDRGEILLPEIDVRPDELGHIGISEKWVEAGLVWLRTPKGLVFPWRSVLDILDG